MSKSSNPKATGYIRLIAGNVVILAFMLVLVEGIASYALLVRDIKRTHFIAERRHTKYDPDLGWVNEPNLYIPDMYKPRDKPVAYLRTNSQGFRSNHDFDAAVPKGKYRIICSGDSFTLGYGVDNDHTWCQLLTALDPRLETLNMGQGGYGVDQAYLWYKRDASKFEHQVHLLAFIRADFDRMQSDMFQGYGKPVIDVENSTLVVKNVPVPKRAYALPPWLTANSKNLERLRSVELLRRVTGRSGSAPGKTGRRSEKKRNEKTQEVLRLIFADLKRLNEERSGIFVLVYLPTLNELKGEEPQEWMKFVEKESQSLGIPLINVFSAFRSLPYADIANKFDGHLNYEGNEFVAMLNYDELKNHPRTSRLLSLNLHNSSP